MRKWAYRVIGILFVIFLMMVLIGYALPRDHRASSSIEVAAAPDSVWKLVSDIARFPSFWRDIDSVEVLPGVAGDTIYRQIDVRGDVLPIRVTERTAPERMVTEIADKNLPFGGTWIYELQAIPGGTRVTVTENGSVYNPVFRFISRVFLDQHATLDSFLSDLARRLGSAAAPMHEAQ